MEIGNIEDMGYDLPYDTFEIKEWELFKISDKNVSWETPTKDRIRPYKRRNYRCRCGCVSNEIGNKKSKLRILYLKIFRYFNEEKINHQET